MRVILKDEKVKKTHMLVYPVVKPVDLNVRFIYKKNVAVCEGCSDAHAQHIQSPVGQQQLLPGHFCPGEILDG